MKAAVLLLAAAALAFAQPPREAETASPVVIHKVEPQYTPEARERGIEGTVVLYAEIGRDGKATHIRVLHSLGYGLDEKAIEAVKQWVFKPGVKFGRTVSTASSIAVKFRIPPGRA